MKNFKTSLAAGAAAISLGVSAPAQAQAGTQFIGQVSPFAGVFCPRDWASASGQLLPINTNQALFSLVGTTYGGDGRTTFGLPDLRGRVPVGYGTGPGLPTYSWGQKSGSTQIVLSLANLPSHTHTGTLAASPSAGDTNVGVRNSFAAAPTGVTMFRDGDPAVNNMHPDTLRIDSAGANQPIYKTSPTIAINWCIALTGIFPSRN